MPSKKRKRSRNEEGKDVSKILAREKTSQRKNQHKSPQAVVLQKTHLNEKAIHNGHYSG